MNTIILIIVLQVAVTLLAGCSVMQDKMDEMNGLSCAPPVHSVCEPNESLLICDSADKTECHGWILE
mgnify:FL=1|jgi:hypothetical protein